MSLDHETGHEVSVTVTATDAAGASVTTDVTIDVANLNEGPTDILFSDLSVDENAAGAVVATLTAEDADDGDTFTYELTDDPSGLFTIEGNDVKLKDGAAVDHEAQDQYTITIEATDAAGASVTKTVTVDVADVNEAPTSIALEEPFVNEGAAGIGISEVFVVDPDGDQDFTFTVSDQRFEVVEGQGGTPYLRLKDGVALDFETEPTVDLSITAEDADGARFAETLTIAVEDNNDAPVIVRVDPEDATVDGGSLLAETAGEGDLVATIDAADEDGDAVTYTLSGAGAGNFTVDGNEIVVADGAAFDYEAGDQEFTLTVTATDEHGASASETMTVVIEDRNEAPTGLTVDPTAMLGAERIVNGSFETGEVTWLKNFNAIEGWTADTGYVQIHRNLGGHSASHGDEYLDTDGEVGADAVYQDVATDAGAVYQLSLDAADRIGRSTNEFEIYWNGDLVAALDPNSTSFEQYVFEVTGTGGLDRLEFRDAGVDDAYGALVDNVSMREIYDGSTLVAPENAAAGVVVATFEASDPDAGETFTFDIVDEHGAPVSDPNFEIVGDELRVRAGADIDYEEAQSHTLRIQSTDSGGATYTETIVVAVDDETGMAVSGAGGADTIVGGAFEDTLYGGGGADTMLGGAGDDVIYDGRGTDYVDGGEGSDEIHLDAIVGTAGVNTIQDTGVDGVDTLVLEAGTGSSFDVQSNFSAASSGIEIIDGSAASGEVLQANGAALDFDFSEIELVGVDAIRGSDSDDRVIASEGDDVVDGRGGNDVLTGGGGDDTLTGGDGDDLFVYDLGDGRDIVDGGVGWTDAVQIEGGLAALGEYGVDWTLTVTDGAVQSQTDDAIIFDGDADGAILVDGEAVVTFENIEQII